MTLLSRSGYTTWQQRQQGIEATSMTTTDALREALSVDLAELAATRVDFYDWALRVPEPKAGSLDFGRFPFQVELYREAAADEDVCIKKATQIGVSAFLVRWTLYWADTRGLTALYVFPTRNDVYDFSDARIKPAIDASEYLRERVRPGYVQNKGLKAIGLGFVYFRGSETKRGLDSVDADILALDEYDTLVQANIGDAERRISGSLVGLIRRVGVPSIDDFGISKEYEKSDQRKWFIKCTGCDEWQHLTFKDNVAWDDDPDTGVPVNARIVCRACAKPLDVTRGEWVARYPDRPNRGYHAPRLIVPGTNLSKIVLASREREPYKRQIHFNKDLAEPFEGEGGRLTRQEVFAATRSEIRQEEVYQGANLVTMGVDVASTRALNVRISEHFDDRVKRSLWIGTVDSFEELDDLMRNYRVNMAAIDHLPEGRLARSFAERHPGRVYLVNFSSSTRGDVVDVDDEQRRIAVKRTELIDATIDRIRSQRNLLPPRELLPPDYVDHMTAVVRRIEKDEEDRVKVTYISTGPDDYLMAEGYDIVAHQGWLIRQSVDHIVNGDGELHTADEMLDFERSDLGDDGADYSDGMDYSEGPGEGEYGDYYE